MKKLNLLTVVTCLVITVLLSGCHSATPVQKTAIKITCRIASRSTGCFDRGGLCDCKLSLLHVSNDTSMRVKNLSVEIVGSELYAHFTDKLPTDASKFEFDVPTNFNDSIARQLGHKMITIQPGTYAVEKEKEGSMVKLKVIIK